MFFVLKIVFFRPSKLHQHFEFCFFFEDRCFLIATYLSVIFFHLSPTFFTENETFCEHKGLPRAFGTMRFTGDFHRKIFPEIFGYKLFLIFCFLKNFWLRKIDFRCSELGKRVVESNTFPWGSFWHCKQDKISTMCFYL